MKLAASAECRINGDGEMISVGSQLCLVGEARQAGGCEGDSGGPVLSLTPGGGRLEIGIATETIGLRGARCGDRTLATSIATISSWVQVWIARSRAWQR